MLFSSGITASVPASPISAVVGLSTIPPLASAGTLNSVSLDISTPGIALITLIAELIALMKNMYLMFVMKIWLNALMICKPPMMLLLRN